MDWTYLITTALGSGGLASLLTWLFNRGLYKARAVRDREGVWKEMYESNNQTLLQQNDEIRQLRTSVSRVEKMLFRISACRYYDVCPVKPELQDYTTKFATRQPGQSPIIRKTHRNARDHPYVEGDLASHGGEPP